MEAEMKKQSILPVLKNTLAVSADEAAEALGIAPSSLEKDRREGHLNIPFAKAGRRVIYSLADLGEWLRENRYWPEGGGK
jgi:predicted ArsR family transcriptional regulator